MTAHRFRLELAGQTVYGLAFTSETDLDAFMAVRTTVGAADLVDTRPPAPPPDPEPVHRGRPSFDALIAEAVQALDAELKPRLTLRERARRVLKYLAPRCAPPEMPSRDTVERHLRGKNCKKNCKNGGKNRGVRRSAPEARKC